MKDENLYENNKEVFIRDLENGKEQAFNYLFTTRYEELCRIVFLTTHIVSDIESIAKDVLLMRQGLLVMSGSPEKLMAQVGGSGLEDVYMAYLGED